MADQLDITLTAVSEARSDDDATLDEIRAIEDATDEAFDRFGKLSLPPTEPVE